MFDVVGFGEIMLRLSSPGYKKIVQSSYFDINYGGAEANVMVALSCLGAKTAFVSALPQNALGDAAINYLKQFGVDTTYIKRKGKKMGIYFLEKGVSQRSSSVIYDREGSAINQVLPDDFDWEMILSNAKIYFFTGITAALSENVLNRVIESCTAAKKRGVLVAFDINYRSKLWDYESAHKTIDELMQYVDILITNEEHVRRVLKIDVEKKFFDGIDMTQEAQIKLYKSLCQKYPNLKKVILAARRSISASKNIFFAYASEDNNIVFSKKREIEIIDRVGGGDAFTAGALYGILNNLKTEDTLEIATAMCLLKHTMEGDAAIVSKDELMQTIKKDEKGLMNR